MMTVDEPGNAVVVAHEGPIATVRLSRPKVHNALNADVLSQLDDAISSLTARPGTRAIILTGTGAKAFSAGADLDELADLDADAAHEVMARGQAVMRRIERSTVPVIAAVNGLALGGGFELVLCCSFAVVATNAAFGLPESGLGLIPGYGGTQRLARAVGPATARYVMLAGTRLEAARAYELGLAVVPPTAPDELMSTADSIARDIAGKGPHACRSILEAVDQGLDGPIDVGLSLETSLAALAIGGSESDEGIAAFREKRIPEFGGQR